MRITDSEWCGDLAEQGASCFHTLTSETRDIPKEQWDEERVGLVCTPAVTFADWKAAIEKLCSISGRCDYPTRVALRRFFKRVEKLAVKSQDFYIHDIRADIWHRDYAPYESMVSSEKKGH